MTFNGYEVDSDPFLIEIREKLTELEADKDATYKASELDPGSIKQRIAYDAALMRWAHAKVDYERALKAAIGL